MTDEPCQTCNDVPEVCASVPGLRHCEKANREATAPEDWYANYRRVVEGKYASEKFEASGALDGISALCGEWKRPQKPPQRLRKAP